MTVARPFLKMAGGKTSLLPEILSRLPPKISTYYEPFVGGGAVFFALAAERRFKKAVLGDVNSELIRAYGALRVHPDAVIEALKKHVYDKTHYYRVRAQDPKSLKLSDRAARFIYLNRTCFNGLYRVNKKGLFNVPFGDYKNPTICDEENLRAAARALTAERLVDGDFYATLHGARVGDVVYFDPPYVPLSKTSSFTGYAKGGFDLFDQERLRNTAYGLVERGVHVLLSNSDTPYVRELYGSKSFRFEKVQARRNINSKGGKRGKVGELLISGRRA
jgi:DNA adenine methylase